MPNERNFFKSNLFTQWHLEFDGIQPNLMRKKRFPTKLPSDVMVTIQYTYYNPYEKEFGGIFFFKKGYSWWSVLGCLFACLVSF